MKLHHTFALALATVFLFNFLGAPTAGMAVSRGESFSAEVIYVADGDSIVVQRKKNQPALRVDLAGLEAKPGGEAQRFLNELAYGKVVDVEVIGTEAGLRARVFLDGRDLGEALVDADLARETDASLHPVRRMRRLGRLVQIFLGSDGRS